MQFLEIFHTSIFRDKRLELPREFTVKYGKELSSRAIIKIPNGIWHIGMRKAKGHLIFFENGWPEFIKFYSICVGHLIVFRYDGNSKFQVHIFGMDATEIDYPPHIGNNTNHEVEMTSNDSDDVEVVSTHSDSTRSNNEPARREFPRRSRRQTTTVPTRSTKAFQKTLEASEAFPSENPFFKVIMQASYMKGSVRVPKAFATSHFTNLTQMGVTLRIPDGRTWEVGYLFRAPAERRICRGWRKFVAENHLKEGDVCVFELVDRKKFEMNVNILRQQNTPPTPKIRSFQATLEAAEQFTAENPFFKVVMQASYMKGGMVRVPAVFANSHLTNITQMMITLRISDGRTWEVRYVSQPPAIRMLYQGWRKFFADNDLKEGDVCVFELVGHRKNFEMNVHIFRHLHYTV